MPSATTQHVLAEVHPVDHERHQIQPGQIRGQQLGQRGLGLATNRRETADLLVAERLLGDLLADRLQPDRVAARRQPGQHPLHRHPAQDLGAS